MKNKRISISDYIFYLAMFFISINGWKYGWFGIQKYNPISEIPLILYLIVSCLEKKIIIKKHLVGEVLIVVMMLINSFFMYHKFNYSFEQYINGVKLFAFYYLMYFSIRRFLTNATLDSLKRMFICILKSFNFALVIAIIQIINIYVHRFEWYREFCALFTINLNDINSRIRFSFAEPSDTINYIIFLYLPVCLLLSMIGYKFKWYDKVQFFLLLICSGLTFSINVILMFGCLITCWFIYQKKKWSIIIIPTLMIMYFMLASADIFEIFITNERISALLTSPVKLFMTDDSIKTRICYYIVVFISMKKFPFLGYGWNFFLPAMKDSITYIPSNIITNEFIHKVSNSDIYVSYEILFCSLVCGGVIGGVWLIYIFRTRFLKCSISKLKPFIITFMIGLFLGVGFMRTIPVIIFIELCSNENVSKIIKEYRND